MRQPPPELSGAVLLAVLSAPAALIVSAAAPARISGTIAAVTLLAGVAISGAIGGLAYRLGAARRDRASSLPWLAGAYSAGAALVIFTFALLGRAGLRVGDTMLGDVRTFVVLAIAPMIAASIMVDVARREKHAPGHDPFTLPPSGFRYGTLFLGALLITMARARSDSEVPQVVEIPRTVEEARAMLADAESAATSAPNSPQAQHRYGVVLTYLDRQEEAVARLEAAMRLDNTDIRTRTSLGWAYMRAQRYDDALPHLRRAEREWPDDVDLHHNLGWTLLHLQRYDEAVQHYRAALNLDSTRAGIHAELAWTFYQQSNEEEALSHALRALELDSTAVETHGLAGAILQTQAKFAEARSHFREASRRSPERADFWALAGIASYLMKDVASARREFDEAWRRDSTYFAPHSLAADMRQDVMREAFDDALQAGKPLNDRTP